MTRRFLLLTGLVIAAAAAAAGGSSAGGPQAPSTPATPRARLRIPAVALDRAGRAVTDLRPEELEVWIGVYRVPIDSLIPVNAGADRANRTIVLLLDDLTQDPAVSPRIKDVGGRFIARMAPGDRMGVAALDRETFEISDDPVRVRKRLDAHFGGTGIQPPDLVGELMLERVAAIARQVAELPGGKAIVAIGGAWLFDRPIHPASVGRDLRREWVEAIRWLAAADTQLYVVDPGGVGATPTWDGASGFARETGGHAFTNTNDFDAAVQQILREIDNRYVIEVADPPVFRSSDLRELDVRVKRKDVRVRARRWVPGTDVR